MSYITAIGTAVPENRFPQRELAAFMQAMLPLSETQKRHLSVLYRATGIQSRHSVLPDFNFPENPVLFRPSSPFPKVKERMTVYRTEALPLSLKATEACFSAHPVNTDTITHLITVSCTGMYAPGLDIDLVKALKLPTTVKRACINFMGCYAAIIGLKTAQGFCQTDPHAKVLLVCTELCTLHFREKTEEDDLLSGSLFSDGAAAVLMEANPQKNTPKLKCQSFFNDVFLNGASEMAWEIGNDAFEMRLTGYVPELLRSGIGTLLKKANFIDTEAIDFFAIHPGGKKIVETIQQELQLEDEKIANAFSVLKNYGNMSSPTVLFVLKEIWEICKEGTHAQEILAMAFGPGLTVETAMLSYLPAH